MAKNRDDKNPATDAEESELMDEADARTQAPEPSRPAGKGTSLNLFSMYKPNQGKQIRLWSAVGAGLLILGGWVWMVPKLQLSFSAQNEATAPAVAFAISALVALVVWYFVGVNRTSVDFLIATESEMKEGDLVQPQGGLGRHEGGHRDDAFHGGRIIRRGPGVHVLLLENRCVEDAVLIIL